MNLNTVRGYLGECRFSGTGDREVTGYCIDSRQVKPGNLFFALPGQNTDGHQFVAGAIEKGACGAVVNRLPRGFDNSLLKQAGLILVPDVKKALQQLALAIRLKAGIPVVAVTGSNGKTTTKDLIAAVLESTFCTLKTKGNFNNELGLPLTLLSVEPDHQIGVVEMGMRGLGQIRELCSIARPDYGVITNIGTAHYELLGSQENIARAKGELLDSLPDDGVAVLNRDDPWCVRLGTEVKNRRPGLRIVYYGFHPEAEVRASQPEMVRGGTEFQLSWEGTTLKAYLPLPGEHNVQNALAAVAVGLIAGVPLEDALKNLSQASISEKRLARVAGKNGSTIIDDTYNANPGSVVASLEVLAALPGNRKIAVLGTQRELGAFAEQGHREVGAKVAELGIDFLLVIGGEEVEWLAREALSKGLETRQVYCCSGNEEAIRLLSTLLQPNDIVLVKGSRALAMEQIVEAVTE